MFASRPEHSDNVYLFEGSIYSEIHRITTRESFLGECLSKICFFILNILKYAIVFMTLISATTQDN